MKLLVDLKNGDISLSQLKSEFGINIREYDDRYVLNYDQINSAKMKFHPYVRCCRQLIISKDFERVLHRSFDRFFNYGEDPNSDNFDICNAEIFEKLDGSLIGLYHDGEKWCHCSKSMAYAEGPISNQLKYKTFSDIIDNEVDLSAIFEKGNINYSYLFELTSKYDPHVVKYQDTKMVLLAVRNKLTGEYINLEDEAKRIGWEFLPRKFTFKSFDEILENVNSLPATEEGYVCILGDWRLKVKSPLHVAISSMKGDGALSPKRIIQIVHDCNEEEYLSYYPEDREFFEPYILVREKLEDYFESNYNKYKNIESQKDFALSIREVKYNTILFRMRAQNKTFKEVLNSLTSQQIEKMYELLKENI